MKNTKKKNYKTKSRRWNEINWHTIKHIHTTLNYLHRHTTETGSHFYKWTEIALKIQRHFGVYKKMKIEKKEKQIKHGSRKVEWAVVKYKNNNENCW